MRCPVTPEIWQHYQDTGDPRVAEHLQSCAACRVEAEALDRLQLALTAMPAREVTGEVSARLRLLAAAVPETSLTCDQVQAIIDPWLEGELDAAQSFLLEDHLLACAPCTAEVARTEALLTTLRVLPQFAAPAVIAERIEAARVPWWQKLLPAPAMSRPLGWASGFAAVLVLALTLTQRAPQVARVPAAPLAVPQVAFRDPELPSRPLVTPLRVTPEATPAAVEAPVVAVERRHRQQGSPEVARVPVAPPGPAPRPYVRIPVPPRPAPVAPAPRVVDEPKVVAAVRYEAESAMRSLATYDRIRDEADKSPDYGTL